MRANPFHDRGPSLPHGGGGLDGLIDSFAQGVAHALGWRAGSAIAQALGPTALIALALVALAVYIWRRRNGRRY